MAVILMPRHSGRRAAEPPALPDIRIPAGQHHLCIFVRSAPIGSPDGVKHQRFPGREPGVERRQARVEREEAVQWKLPAFFGEGASCIPEQAVT